MNNSIFFEKYNVTSRDLETYLAEGLSRGGDYADLYFEYRINHSIILEEQIIKSATKSINIGVGVRVKVASRCKRERRALWRVDIRRQSEERQGRSEQQEAH